MSASSLLSGLIELEINIGRPLWGRFGFAPKKYSQGFCKLLELGNKHTNPYIEPGDQAGQMWGGREAEGGVKGVLEEDVRSVNWEWPRAPAWNLSHNAPIRSTPFNITLEDHDHRGDRSHGLRWPWSSSLSSKAITVMTMAAVKLVEQVKYLSEMNCELWILFDGLTPGWTLQSASWYWMTIRKVCQYENDYVWQSQMTIDQIMYRLELVKWLLCLFIGNREWADDMVVKILFFSHQNHVFIQLRPNLAIKQHRT